MRSLIMGIVVFFLALGAWASDEENINDLACDQWEVVVEEYATELSNQNDYQVYEKAHRRVRGFLLKAQDKVEGALKNDDSFEAVVMCSLVEEATHGFTQSCLSDSGEEMISESLKQTCLSMHRQ